MQANFKGSQVPDALVSRALASRERLGPGGWIGANISDWRTGV